MTNYNIFDHVLSVISEAHDLDVHIDTFLWPFHDGSSKPTASLEIRLLAGSNDRLAFLAPESGLVATTAAGFEAWVTFRRFYMSLVLGRSRTHHILHASAARAANGKAAVVFGPSNSGKTTVLMALLERGMTLVCDDYSPISHEHGGLVALPVGVTVSENTINLFPWLRDLLAPECRFVNEGEQQWTVHPGKHFGMVTPHEVVEDMDFFLLRPDFGSASRIEQCTVDEALWWLAVGSLNSRNYSPRFQNEWMDTLSAGYELLRGVLSRSRFYLVSNGDIGQTSALIEEALYQ